MATKLHLPAAAILCSVLLYVLTLLRTDVSDLLYLSIKVTAITANKPTNLYQSLQA
jgi:hypothetical protein